MRLLEREMPPDPEIERELEALDRALAGEPVEPDLEHLAQLARELRSERPQPTAADRILRAVRNAPRDPEWVNTTLTRLEALVGAGDEADLAEQTVELVTERRSGAPTLDDMTA